MFIWKRNERLEAVWRRPRCSPVRTGVAVAGFGVRVAVKVGGAVLVTVGVAVGVSVAVGVAVGVGVFVGGGNVSVGAGASVGTAVGGMAVAVGPSKAKTVTGGVGVDVQAVAKSSKAINKVEVDRGIAPFIVPSFGRGLIRRTRKATCCISGANLGKKEPKSARLFGSVASPVSRQQSSTNRFVIKLFGRYGCLQRR
jgi:hypothetical protein